MEILLEIVTPEAVAYSDRVNMVTVPSVSGTMGILPRHTSLFAQLVEGEVKIKKATDEIFLSIGGGFVEVTGNKVIVLVTRAVHASELNENEIINAKNQAKEALKSKPKGKEYLAASTLLRQSLVDMRLLHKRKLVKYVKN